MTVKANAAGIRFFRLSSDFRDQRRHGGLAADESRLFDFSDPRVLAHPGAVKNSLGSFQESVPNQPPVRTPKPAL
jgi:hypothetical protein